MSERVIGGFEPNPKQLDAAMAALDPDCRVVVLDGAIRSGKTQIGARILVEWCVKRPALYLVGRATYRALRDSTMRAMVFGDGGLPPLIPPELVKKLRLSDDAVQLNSGAEILFRSLEESQVSKILNLSLGGVLIDQVEELDGGPDGERVFDTLLGRMSDERGARKLLAVANPAGLTSWQYRRLIDEPTRDRGVRRVHFALRDNAANLPADYVADMEATKLTRPHWHDSYVLGLWGRFSGQAYTELDPAVHVVPPIKVPSHWETFESCDHGAASPTAWLAWAAGEDGEVLVHGEHYEAGQLISHHAARILELRKQWYPDGRRVVVWADPSMGAKSGLQKWGAPASVMTEYAEHGILLNSANNDRAAGYARLLELLHVEPGRPFPVWHPRYGEFGSPRMFISSRCTNLIEQLKSAPIASDGVGAGQCVDPKVESAHLHAHAAARYGAMSRPSVAVAPETEPWWLTAPLSREVLKNERLVEVERARESVHLRRRLYTYT